MRYCSPQKVSLVDAYSLSWGTNRPIIPFNVGILLESEKSTWRQSCKIIKLDPVMNKSSPDLISDVSGNGPESGGRKRYYQRPCDFGC